MSILLLSIVTALVFNSMLMLNQQSNITTKCFLIIDTEKGWYDTQQRELGGFTFEKSKWCTKNQCVFIATQRKGNIKWEIWSQGE